MSIAISVVNSFHPSAQQKQASYMNVESDVEKRIQALVAKDRIRIKSFFIDFDKLRKGTVGEAPVSIIKTKLILSISSAHASVLSISSFLKLKFNNCWANTNSKTVLWTTPISVATLMLFLMTTLMKSKWSRTQSPHPTSLIRKRIPFLLF